MADLAWFEPRPDQRLRKALLRARLFTETLAPLPPRFEERAFASLCREGSPTVQHSAIVPGSRCPAAFWASPILQVEVMCGDVRSS